MFPSMKDWREKDYLSLNWSNALPFTVRCLPAYQQAVLPSCMPHHIRPQLMVSLWKSTVRQVWLEKAYLWPQNCFFGGAIWFDCCTCKKIKSKITWFKRQSWNKWMDAVLLHLLLTQLLIATYDVISNIHWRWQQDCHRSWTYFICGCWKCMENR